MKPPTVEVAILACGVFVALAAYEQPPARVVLECPPCDCLCHEVAP